MNLKNLFTRALTAGVYVGLIVGSLFLGASAFGCLCLVILLASMDEFFHFGKRLKIRSAKTLAMFIGSISLLIVVLCQMELLNYKAKAIIPFGMITIPIRELFQRTKNPVYNISFTIFGLVYTFIPMACLFMIGFYDKYVWTHEFQPNMLIAFFFLIWANDTGAYLAGSVLGKHKLFESISPKKTIEGALGGLALTLFGAWVVSMISTQVGLLDWIFISILIVVFGTLGDLFESLLKRKSEVKDSGKIFPGHGGMLDRFDSILFAAPAVFTYLALVGI